MTDNLTPNEEHDHEKVTAMQTKSEIPDVIDIDILEGSKDIPAVDDSSPAELPNEWYRSDTRRAIHQAALDGGGNPTAAVYVALAHVASLVPPEVKTAAVRAPEGFKGNGRTSLNIMIAVVGKSGVGKGGVFKDAKTGLNVKEVDYPPNYMPEGNPVSGEGLAKLYSPRPEPLQEDVETLTLARRNALIVNPEGSELITRMQQRGSTLLDAFLKSIYAESLSSQKADATQSRYVPDGSYSLGIAFGIQPARAAELQEATDSGFAQRSIIVPLYDVRSKLTAADREAFLARYQGHTNAPSDRRRRRANWKPPKSSATFSLDNGPALRLFELRNDPECAPTEEVDAHRPGMLHKLMCLLALLDNPGATGEIRITDQHLKDTEKLLSISDQGRELIANELAKQRTKHTERQAHAETQLEQVKERIGSDQVAKDVKRVVEKLKRLDEGKGVARGKLWTSSVRAKERFNQAVDAAEAEGLLHVRPSPNGQGVRIHLGGKD